MSTFVSIALTLGVCASFLLIGFGTVGLLRGSMNKTRAGLMIAAGLITLLNVIMIAPMIGQSL
jgi:hypothetical protein